MDDFPVRIAEFLESTAGKIRGLSVDRVRNAATWTAVGMVVSMLVFILLIFLGIGLFRLIGELLTFELAYVIFGGLFVIIGAFLWSKRNPKKTEESAVGEDAHA